MLNKHSDRPTKIASLLGEQLNDADPQAKEISTRIILLSSLMEQANQPMYQENRINRGFTTVLAALKLSGEPYELSHQQLNERILLTSVTIFTACEALKKLGLVSISSVSDCIAETIYKLTPEGVNLAERVLVNIHRKEQKMVEVLDDDEKKLLCKLLKRLTRQFDAL